MLRADRLSAYASGAQGFLTFTDDLQLASARGVCRLGDTMPAFQRERFAQLAPALAAVAKGEKPPVGRYWWEATKGSSKDTDLGIAMLWLLAFSQRLLHCQVGAADQDQADELWRSAKAVTRQNHLLDGRIKLQNYRILNTRTESACEIIPADEAGSQGFKPDVLILNELSQITKQEYANNMLDNASKVPHGLVVLATNAGFYETWQLKLREIARQSSRWIFNRFAQPAPWLDADELAEAAIRNTASRFNRLFHGIWANPNEGSTLDPDDIEAAVTQTGPMTGRHEHNIASEPGMGGWMFLAGLDLGIKHDHSALVVLAVQYGSPRIRLAWAQAWKPRKGKDVQLDEVEAGIWQVHERFHLEKLLYDPNQAIGLAQRLSRRGLLTEEMTFSSGKNLDLMANTLVSVFKTRTIDLYRDEQLIRDLGRLTIVEKSWGYKLESASTDDGHADTATALAIVLPEAQLRAHHRAHEHHQPTMMRVEPDTARLGVHLQRKGTSVRLDRGVNLSVRLDRKRR